MLSKRFIVSFVAVLVCALPGCVSPEQTALPEFHGTLDMRLDKTVFAPSEEITVHVKNNYSKTINFPNDGLGTEFFVYDENANEWIWYRGQTAGQMEVDLNPGELYDFPANLPEDAGRYKLQIRGRDYSNKIHEAWVEFRIA